jgi:biopolymer transport protein ExbD
MKRRGHNQHGGLAELNITPLLDLVFVLLVIFIITTPQMVNNLEIALPSSQVPPRPPNEKPPVIQRILVDEQGNTFLNDKPLIIPVLRQELTQLKLTDPDPSVVVKAADKTAYQNIINVLDMLRGLEITKVGLATRTTPTPTPTVPKS